MCGISAAAARVEIADRLLEALKRLEYRGYDSAGLATVDDGNRLHCLRREGKVRQLVDAARKSPPAGRCGVAHTRWATHGAPSERNAHPHIAGERLALVHNGIIENHRSLRERLQGDGVKFASDTDTEVIVQLLWVNLQKDPGADLVAALRATVAELRGAYAVAVVDRQRPDQVVGCCLSSALLVGRGADGHFLASDLLSMRGDAEEFAQLRDGDIVSITPDAVAVIDGDGKPVAPEFKPVADLGAAAALGDYSHYMEKEIDEQPKVIGDWLRSHDANTLFDADSQALLDRVAAVQIVACGTSYHAALVARYWIESLAGVPCAAEIASEFRYRDAALAPDTLFIAISQSGETADTLEALRTARARDYLGRMSLCNNPLSSMARESDHLLPTEAGPEIGVASTKAFTSQLAALLALAARLSRRRADDTESRTFAALQTLPDILSQTLEQKSAIKKIAKRFRKADHSLFLGRGIHYPIAMEGALKLKEISYIHAEAYPAGELKHGPLALVEKGTPIVALLPDNDLAPKVISNLEEVRSRGGRLHLFVEDAASVRKSWKAKTITLPKSSPVVSPIAHAIPLQLLAYFAALARGNDVDQPRNLAKSVTVE